SRPAPDIGPTAAILPRSTATSAANGAPPAPSKTKPPLITRSKSAMILSHILAAIDVDRRAGDDAGIVGDEEQDRLGAVVVRRQLAQRDQLAKRGVDLFFGLAGSLGHVGAALVPRNAVHAAHARRVHADV